MIQGNAHFKNSRMPKQPVWDLQNSIFQIKRKTSCEAFSAAYSKFKDDESVRQECHGGQILPDSSAECPKTQTGTWNCPALLSTPTLSSSSTPSCFLIRSCFLWAQRGSHSKEGTSSGLGMHAITNNAQHQCTVPVPGIHAELRLTTSSVTSLLFWQNRAAWPYSKFIKAASLRITHKYTQESDWQR